MKIGIDVSQIIYDTGVANYTKELVKSLLQIDKKNEYILFGSSLRARGKLKSFIGGLEGHKNVSYKLLSLPASILQFTFNTLRILNIERITGKIDVFHSSDWYQPKTSRETKNVTTVHDLIAYIFPSSLHPKIVSTQKRRLQLVKKNVDKIITDSETTKDDLIKFLDIREEKIKVISLAASSIFKPQDDEKISEVLTKYKIKKPYILSVATQEPRKNIQKLIDVFSKIKEVRKELNLVLVGKYGWGPGLHMEADDGIIWTGFIPYDDLVSIYCGSRVFVYPALYEGFGLPILESMACGVPVITSNNSSMKEIGKDAAILVDPRSDKQIIRAIELVLDLNLENYQKMVRASLNRAHEYSWAKTAKETLKVYEGVAKLDNRT